jgi:hypothetical protein
MSRSHDRLYRRGADDTMSLMKEFLEKLFKWGIGALFFITPLAYLPTWASPYVTAKLFFS